MNIPDYHGDVWRGYDSRERITLNPQTRALDVLRFLKSSNSDEKFRALQEKKVSSGM